MAGVGHEYFARRYLQNFSTPPRLFYLLIKHISGFQFPTAGEIVHLLSTPKKAKAFLEVRAGIEPAHRSFADSRVTTSPPHHIFYLISDLKEHQSSVCSSLQNLFQNPFVEFSLILNYL